MQLNKFLPLLVAVLCIATLSVPSARADEETPAAPAAEGEYLIIGSAR